MAIQGQLRRIKYLAKVPQFHVHVRVLSVSVSVSMSVSISVTMTVSISMSVFSRPCQFKFGAMNIYVQHGNHSINF
jgi:hypothetical protein